MKRIIIFALVACLFLTGCEVSGETGFSGIGNLVTIDGDSTLYYDKDTRIVYYVMVSTSGGYRGYGFMSPYISENGNYCRYVDKEIVEVK